MEDKEERAVRFDEESIESDEGDEERRDQKR
jgi:hypothetical protein